MIRGDTVDRAVEQTLDERAPVVFGAERRVHLHVGVEGTHELVRGAEVVRARLGADPHPGGAEVVEVRVSQALRSERIE